MLTLFFYKLRLNIAHANQKDYLSLDNSDNLTTETVLRVFQGLCE